MDSDNSDSDSELEVIQTNIISRSNGLSSTSRYSGGKIMRIKLINFMVYDNVEIFPGPGLNLIIGPNGSGKSTTVCGICLGLAGKASFTGRRMRIIDYIKHGKSQATIEIELDDPVRKRNIVIKRTITSTGNSQYCINNHVVKESAVEKEVARFNILMNNLCQFLPQERVSEFCKMNAVQLLESMQQAVGNEDLFKSHNELKELRNSCRDLENEISNKAGHVISEKKKNERIEAEAKAYAEIKKLIEKSELLQEKTSILRYKDTHEQVQAQKLNKRQLEAKEKKFHRSLEPIRKELITIKNSITQYSNELKKKSQIYFSHKKKLDHLEEQIRLIDGQIFAVCAELMQKIKEQNASEDKINALETQLCNIRTRHDQFKNKEQELKMEQERISAGIESVGNQINAKDVTLEEISHFINNSTYQKQALENDLKKLSGVEHKKLEGLQKLDCDTYNAVLWLRANRNKFKRQVYDPILMMIDVPSEENCMLYYKYIESHIGFRDLIAFVCEDKEDSRLLVEKLRNEKGWAINTVLAPTMKPSEYQPRIPHHDLKRSYHFLHYLKDIFKAPDPIISFLCATYNIHNTPIGNENTERYLTQITSTSSFNRHKFSRFYTKESMYVLRQSRYGAQHISVTNSLLSQPRILSSFKNTTDQQKQIEDKIKTIVTEIQVHEQESQQLRNKRQKLSEELEVFRNERKAYYDAKSELRNLKLLIAEKERTLESCKRMSTNIEKLKETTQNTVDAKNKEKIDNLAELCSILKVCSEVKQDTIKLQFYAFAMSKKQSLKDKKLKDEEEAHRNFELRFREAEQEYQRLKQLAIKLLREASEICGMAINDNNIAAVREKYGDLDKSMDEINAEIHNINATISCAGQGDKSIYDEHRQRKEDILKGEEDLKNAKFKLENLKNEMERKKEAWLSPLKALIEKISDTFSKYFRSLGCAGELGLKVSENPDDFDKYGLSVQVKFRDKSPLQELSHAHHSGGECSVSTIIFILALQKLTEVPFRCVDEINQGMDSVNERRIFELVAMSSGTSSQYFLLTPKLLPRLTYPKDIKVHIIMNAPAVPENINWRAHSIVGNVIRSETLTDQ